MSRLPIPNDAAKMVDASGKGTPVYRQLFQRFADAIQSQIDDLAAILASITSLTADVAGTVAALASKADKTTEVRAIGSIDGGGTLDEALITFALDGDEDAPGNSYFYGTNGSGDKGWYAQSGIGSGVYDPAGTAAAAVAAHEAASDPHPQYLTAAEGNAAYAALADAFTDEKAQDAVGAMVDGSTLEYVDATPLLRVKDDGITNAKLANMAAGALKARKTASTGDPEDCTLTEVINANIASVAQGDILYFNGTSWTRLAAGTSGDFLKTQGTGANPVWATPSGGGGGGITVGVEQLASATTISTTTETDLVVKSLAAGSYLVWAQVGGYYALGSPQTPDFYITDGTTYWASTTVTASTSEQFSSSVGPAVVVLGSTTTVKIRVKHQTSSSVNYLDVSSRQSKPYITFLAWLKYA